MEFMSRSGGAQPQQHGTSHAPSPTKKNKKLSVNSLTIAMMIGVGIILVFLVFFLVASKDGYSEAQLVDKTKYQAVFLSNGQVYFGKVTSLNKDYMVLNDIFYIEAQSGEQANNNNYTLRKLGTSELHAPQDQMVVNHEQITFWENLKDDGRVVSAIKEYKKDPSKANQVQQPADSSSTQPSDTTQSGSNEPQQ